MKLLASSILVLVLASVAVGCVVHTQGGSSYKAKKP